MAYTIISQNNNTTTLTDGVNTITVPSRVNLTSGNFTIVEVNNNMATLEDGDGNVYRDIPCVASLVDAGGGSGLPDQTGQGGKFLITDGTNASWSDSVSKSTVPLSLQTTSPAGTMLTLKNNMGRALNFVAVGTASFKISAYGQVEIDKNFLPSSDNSITLGYRYLSNAPTCWSCVFTKKISSSVSPNDIIIPAVAGTMAVIQVNTTITLAAADWSSNTQTVSVTGMTATGVVLVSPDPTDQSAYTSAGIICSAQAAGTLTFTATNTPSSDIDVVVVML